MRKKFYISILVFVATLSLTFLVGCSSKSPSSTGYWFSKTDKQFVKYDETKNNLNELLYAVADKLEEVKDAEEIVTPQDVVVEYNFVEPEAPFTITLEDDGVYNVTGPAIKRLFDKLDVSTDANARLFAKKLQG